MASWSHIRILEMFRRVGAGDVAPDHANRLGALEFRRRPVAADEWQVPCSIAGRDIVAWTNVPTRRTIMAKRQQKHEDMDETNVDMDEEDRDANGRFVNEGARESVD